MLSWFKKNYPIISIILLGAIIRFLFILKYGDFWDDEMFSFIYAQKEWPQGLVYWLWETNPPLHMLILKVWFFVFPATEFWVRIPSLIFGTATIFPVYKLAKLIFNKNTALISAFFIAIHSYAIFWSATARTYSLLMLLSSLSVYYFYRIFCSSLSQKNDKTFLAIINLLLLLSHLSAILLILSQAVIIFIINRKKFFSWIKINLMPFILSFSWLTTSFFIKRNNSLEKSWLLNLHHDVETLLGPLVNTFAGIHFIAWGGAITIIIIGIILFVSAQEFKEKNCNYFIVFNFVLIPIILIALFKVWHVKLIIYTIPLVTILVPYTLLKITKNRLITIWVIFMFATLGIYNAFISIPLTDWGQIQYYLDKNYSPNTTFIYNNFILKTQIDRYIKTDMQSFALDIARDPEKNWDELVTQKNYLHLYFSDEQTDEWFKKNELDKYNKIILLQGEYDYMVRLNKPLEKNNFVLEEEKTKAHLSGNYYLYTYVKNDQTTSNAK